MSYLIDEETKKEFVEIENENEIVNELSTDILALESYRAGLILNKQSGLSISDAARKIMNVGLSNIKHVNISLEDVDGDKPEEATKGRFAALGAKIAELWNKVIDTVKRVSAKVIGFIKSRLSASDAIKRRAIRAIAELKSVDEQQGNEVTAGKWAEWLTTAKAQFYINYVKGAGDFSRFAEAANNLRDSFRAFKEWRGVLQEAVKYVSGAMSKGGEITEDMSSEKCGAKIAELNSKVKNIIDGTEHLVATEDDGNFTIATFFSMEKNFSLAMDDKAKEANAQPSNATLAQLRTNLQTSGAMAKMLSDNSIGFADFHDMQMLISSVKTYIRKIKQNDRDADVAVFDKFARGLVTAHSNSILSFAKFFIEINGIAGMPIMIAEQALKRVGKENKKAASGKDAPEAKGKAEEATVV